MKKNNYFSNNIEERQIRKKILILSSAIAMMSVFVSIFQGKVWLWTLPISFALLTLSLVKPLCLLPFINGSDKLHSYIQRASIWIVFYIFVSFFSFIIRRLRSDPLNLKRKSKESLWEKISDDVEDANYFDRQF